MEYKKTIILLALAVFLLSITCVSASEIDDTIASENANTIELSADNDIIEDNLQTTEENDELTLTDNDVLGADSATYSDLAAEIGQSGNVKLTHKNYTYNTGATAITITEANKVIDGDGAVIDMAGSTIRAFTISTSGVTIKNLTIKNANCNSAGGAIYFSSSGTVTNCNFADNKATGDISNGGAVYFNDDGEVTNCNFIDNEAYYNGAVWIYSGTVSNCNFTNNTASADGGAISMNSGSVENCNFTDNSADWYGGAVCIYSGTVSNCNFTDNTATRYGGAIYFLDQGTVTNCNFTDNTANRDGGAVYFLDEGTVSNCNFVDNSASRGGAIFSDQWYAAADTCIFKRNSGDNVNTVIYPPTLNVDDFTTVYGSGEKLTFDLKTNSSIPVPNGNILISVYFKDNGEWVRNYTCLSGEGWIPNLPVGSYIAVFNTEYAEFQKINRTVTITLPNVRYSINVTSLAANNRTVNITAKSNIPQDILEGKLLFILPNGDEIDANYSSNGTWWASYTFNDYGVYQVNASYAGLDNVAVNKGTIAVTAPEHTFSALNYTINGNDNPVIELSNDFYFDPAYDAAFVNGIVINRPVTIKGNGSVIDAKGQARIFYVRSEDTVIENLTLKNAHANSEGGAVFFYSNGELTNCNFTDNTAEYGGSVYFGSNGEVVNCYFTDNTATYYGGAIYFYNNGAVKKSYFKDNSANNYSDIYCNSELILEDNTFVNNETNTSDAINIANAKLTLSKTAFTYNTKVQKPTVTLTNGAVLKEGVDYTLQWSTASPKNAGTYTVTVTGIGAYTGTAKATFVINKAANPLSVKAKTVKVKFSKLKKKAQTLAVSKVVKFTKKGQGTLTYAKSSGNEKITVNKKTGKVTIKKGLKKGTYKVKVKIKAKGNANYKASAFKTVTFKIKVK